MKILMDNITRTIIDVQYQTSHATVITQMQIEHLEPLTREDDILVAAVSITQQKTVKCNQ